MIRFHLSADWVKLPACPISFEPIALKMLTFLLIYLWNLASILRFQPLYPSHPPPELSCFSVLAVRPLVCLLARLSVCFSDLSASLSIFLTIHTLSCLCFGLSACLLACLPTCLPACLSAFL